MAAILGAFTAWATTFSADALSVIEDNAPLLLAVFGGMIAVGIFLKLVRRVAK